MSTHKILTSFEQIEFFHYNIFSDNYKAIISNLPKLTLETTVNEFKRHIENENQEIITFDNLINIVAQDIANFVLADKNTEELVGHICATQLSQLWFNNEHDNEKSFKVTMMIALTKVLRNLFYYTPVWNYILREYFLEQYYLQFGENADSPTHEMYKELEDVIDHYAILGGKVTKFRDKVQGVLDSKKYIYKIIVKTDTPHTDLDFKMLINCNHVEVQEIKRV